MRSAACRKKEYRREREKKDRIKRAIQRKRLCATDSGDKSALRFKASGFHRESQKFINRLPLPFSPDFIAYIRMHRCRRRHTVDRNYEFHLIFPAFPLSACASRPLPFTSPACRPRCMEWRPLAAVGIRNLFPDDKSSSTYADHFFLHHKSVNRDSPVRSHLRHGGERQRAQWGDGHSRVKGCRLIRVRHRRIAKGCIGKDSRAPLVHLPGPGAIINFNA